MVEVNESKVDKTTEQTQKVTFEVAYNGISSLIKTYPELETQAKNVQNSFTSEGGSDDENKNKLKFITASCYMLAYNKVKELIDKPDNIDVKIDKFGFSDLCEDIVAAYLTTGEEISTQTVKANIEKCLKTNIRETSYDNLPLSELKQDIINTYKLYIVETDTSGISKKAKAVILANPSVKTSIAHIMNILDGTYRALLSENFGLHPYVGIWGHQLNDKVINTSKNPYSFVKVTADDGLKTIKEKLKLDGFDEPVETEIQVLKAVSDVLYEKTDKGYILDSSSRQIDYNEVFNHTDYTVYFPNKVAEFVFGLQPLQNTLSKRKYEKIVDSSKTGTLTKYMDNFVIPALKEIIENGYVKLFEMIMKEAGYIESGLNTKSALSQLKQSLVEKGYANSEAELSDFEAYDSVVKLLQDSAQYRDKISNRMDALVRSLQTMFILTRYEVVGGETASISVRIADTTGTFKEIDVKDLYTKGIDVNDTSNFEDRIDIPVTASDGNVIPNIRVAEYHHEFNPQLAGVKPLWGFRVQENNIKNGIKANWFNILLGESPSGKEVYSSESRDGSLYFQDNWIHNIYAGSRAGKGVMTMNIIAPAIANNKPLFYLDRKPDMASMFYGLVGDGMFIVSGGGISPSHDVSGGWSEGDGKCYNAKSGALKWYYHQTAPWLNAHPDVCEMLTGVPNLPDDSAIYKSYDRVGDIIYMRAMLFVLGIMALRVNNASNKDVLQQLGGVTDQDEGISGGLVVLLDEFSNFQTGFRRFVSSPTSPLLQYMFELNAASGKGYADYEYQIKECQIDIDALQQEDSEKGATARAKKIRDAERKMSTATRKLEQFKSPYSTAYANTVISCIASAFRAVSDGANAGWKNVVDKDNDIFILGQQIQGAYTSEESIASQFNEDTFFKLTNEGKFYAPQYSYSMPRLILDSGVTSFGQDWFLGNNVKPSAMLNVNGKLNEEWVGKSAWIYVDAKNGSFSTKTMSEGNVDNAKIVPFKAYLVLNDKKCKVSFNNGVVNYDKTGAYQYVGQFAERLANPNNHLTAEDVKKVFDDVTKPQGTYELEDDKLVDGVGFLGLIRLTRKSVTGTDSTDAEIKDLMCESGRVADRVANQMGYSRWQELIYDLSPAGWFTINDIANCWGTNGAFRANAETRLKFFTKNNIALDGTTSTTMQSTPEEYFTEEDVDRAAVGEDFDSDFEENLDGSAEGLDDSETPETPNSTTQPQSYNSLGDLADGDDYYEDTGEEESGVAIGDIFYDTFVEVANERGIKIGSDEYLTLLITVYKECQAEGLFEEVLE